MKTAYNNILFFVLMMSLNVSLPDSYRSDANGYLRNIHDAKYHDPKGTAIAPM